MTTNRLTEAAANMRRAHRRSERRAAEILAGELKPDRLNNQPPQLKPKIEKQPQAAQHWISPQEAR